MNKTINSKAASVIAGMLIASFAMPVFAAELETGLNVSASAGGAGMNVSTTMKGSTKGMERNDLMGRVETKADQEITRRMSALNSLSLRVSEMKKLPDDEKMGFSSEIKTQIDAMTSLRAKIVADVDANATSSLRDDMKSITASYRIFLLIIPRGAIEAAADRIKATVAIMQDLAVKLQARITTAQTAGANVTAAMTAMADFNAKVADAGVQAAAASSEVVALTPDNGDQAKFTANQTALKDARAKIVAAQKDLLTARNDARTIVKVFATVKVNATTTASSTSHDE